MHRQPLVIIGNENENYEIRMASFLLRPQDGGRDIEIPGGKTTIGRGPFLGVRKNYCLLATVFMELILVFYPACVHTLTYFCPIER